VPAKLPGFQLYAVALPVAVSVDVCPAHTVAGFAEAAIIGAEFTVTVVVADAVQPFVVPVTIYVVVDPGVTVTGVPDKFPGIQL
jgi:hypothetical protein